MLKKFSLQILISASIVIFVSIITAPANVAFASTSFSSSNSQTIIDAILSQLRFISAELNRSKTLGDLFPTKFTTESESVRRAFSQPKNRYGNMPTPSYESYGHFLVARDDEDVCASTQAPSPGH